jgi:hypothetical protein
MVHAVNNYFPVVYWFKLVDGSKKGAFTGARTADLIVID